MAMTGYTPMGMLFSFAVRTVLAIIPAESIMVEDVSVALEVITRAICDKAKVEVPL